MYLSFRCVHVVTNDRIYFSFKAEYCSILCVPVSLNIHWLAVVNNAAIIMKVQIPLLMYRFHLFGYVTISWVVRFVVILIFFFVSVYVCDGVLECVIFLLTWVHVHVKARSWQPLSSVTVYCALAEPEGLKLFPRISVSVSGALGSPVPIPSFSAWSVECPSLSLRDCLSNSLSLDHFSNPLFISFKGFLIVSTVSTMPVLIYIPISAEGFPSSSYCPALVIPLMLLAL